MDFRPPRIARRLLGLDVVFKLNPQGDSLIHFPFRPSVHGQPLNAPGNGFFGVVLAQGFAAGEAFLSGGAE